MGKPIKGSIERALTAAQLPQNPAPSITPPTTQNPPTPTTAVNDPHNYIVLPARAHGTYQYADTLVAMELSHKGKNWNDSHKLLADEGAYMLSIRQFVDFLNLLQSGSAFDGSGDPVQKPQLDEILDEIWTIRNPWRSEWLDAQFESRGGVIGIGSKIHIHYEHRFVNGQLTSQRPAEQLKDYLASNKTPGIILQDWLTTTNEHGLPKANSTTVQNGLYYWAPTNGYVAGFGADSDWAGLYCVWYPADSGSGLWVRAARENKTL